MYCSIEKRSLAEVLWLGQEVVQSTMSVDLNVVLQRRGELTQSQMQPEDT